mmetsp:Transcript_15168/g.32673  ORF Transcript_15168/g.32673 Transcript_15168/m.32673 type:complete len:232 (+) Transcript_15168:364-1059(+)
MNKPRAPSPTFAASRRCSTSISTWRTFTRRTSSCFTRCSWTTSWSSCLCCTHRRWERRARSTAASSATSQACTCLPWSAGGSRRCWTTGTRSPRSLSSPTAAASSASETRAPVAWASPSASCTCTWRAGGSIRRRRCPSRWTWARTASPSCSTPATSACPANASGGRSTRRSWTSSWRRWRTSGPSASSSSRTSRASTPSSTWSATAPSTSTSTTTCRAPPPSSPPASSTA